MAFIMFFVYIVFFVCIDSTLGPELSQFQSALASRSVFPPSKWMSLEVLKVFGCFLGLVVALLILATLVWIKFKIIYGKPEEASLLMDEGNSAVDVSSGRTLFHFETLMNLK